jgi:hypothetical protein
MKIRWFPPSRIRIGYKNSILYLDPTYLKPYYKNHPSKIRYNTWPDEIGGLPEEFRK